MAEFANVTSVEAVVRFRGALATFVEEAEGILQALDRQAQRMLQWIETDAATHWRLQVLDCHEKISRARSALDTAMMKKSKDYTPSCIEEKDNLRTAKERLRRAEEKTQIVRKWARTVREEFEEYRGKINQLRDCLGIQAPRGLAVLDRSLRSLERYVALTPPELGREPAFVGSGSVRREVGSVSLLPQEGTPPVGIPQEGTPTQPQPPAEAPSRSGSEDLPARLDQSTATETT